MKTKFLLHGGRLKLPDPRNDSYFRTLTQDLRDGDEVLCIGFARRSEAERREVFEREKKLFMRQTSSAINVVNATYEDLIGQVQVAKAIHITGGQTAELIEDIRQYPEFITALRGKTVGGSSAGACLFSKYCYSDASKKILEGLGLLPIRLLVHYGNPEFGGTEASVLLLEQYSHKLELVCIEECAWVERQVDL